VDRMVYVAMTGAEQTMLAQAVNSHNLANASTPGFRADLHSFGSLSVEGPGQPTRVNAVAQPEGFDPGSGPVTSTGRALDVAVQGDGWIAVQAPDGTEAYTRAGDLRVSSLGLLSNGAGHSVMGNDGPIALPPYSELSMGVDGTISIVPLGQSADTLAVVDRIKLVNPEPAQMVKGSDGLIRMRDGVPADADASVQLMSATLESSNVNAADVMVNMIQLARQFEMHVKLMQGAEENAEVAARLLRLGG